MKHQVNARLSQAAIDKLDVLAERYGTQTTALEIAVDRLYQGEMTMKFQTFQAQLHHREDDDTPRARLAAEWGRRHGAEVESVRMIPAGEEDAYFAGPGPFAQGDVEDYLDDRQAAFERTPLTVLYYARGLSTAGRQELKAIRAILRGAKDAELAAAQLSGAGYDITGTQQFIDRERRIAAAAAANDSQE